MGNQQSGSSAAGAPPAFKDPFLQAPAPRVDLLRAAFEVATTGNVLSGETYNEVMRDVERSEIMLVRTPLGRRMFERAAGGREKMEKGQFWREMNVFLKMGREQRVIYSFGLHDVRGTRQISKQDFLEFCEQTATIGLQLFGEMLATDGHRLNVTATSAAGIEAAAAQTTASLRAIMGAEFDFFDVTRRGVWTAQEFKNWCTTSKRDGLVLEVGELRMRIPFHFINF